MKYLCVSPDLNRHPSEPRNMITPQSRRMRLRPKLGVFMLTLGLTSLAHGQETFNLQPTQDAYLQDGTRFNDNFLKVKPDSRVSYLKFEVTGLADPLKSATLQLQENGNNGNGTLRVFRGSHNNWTERNLSVLNAPTEDGQVGTFTGAVNSAEIIRIDVTPLITVDGTYSIIVKQDAGGDSITFGSSESSREPLLIIETSNVGPVTYLLTVHSGTGDGDYPAATSVNIVANAPPSGQCSTNGPAMSPMSSTSTPPPLPSPCPPPTPP